MRGLVIILIARIALYYPRVIDIDLILYLIS
jgi:hypothetical protein